MLHVHCNTGKLIPFVSAGQISLQNFEVRSASIFAKTITAGKFGFLKLSVTIVSRERLVWKLGELQKTKIIEALGC